MILEGSALVLLVLLGVGLGQLLRGPSAVDRMLTAQLLSTAGVGVTLLLVAADASEAIVVALVLALLGAISGVTFARRYRLPPNRHAEREDSDA